MSKKAKDAPTAAELPETLDLRSLDIAGQRRAELLRLFPEVHTEGGKIDFERLRAALGESIDTGRERYGLTWPGKAACAKTIQAPSMGTLLPVPVESVNFDTTENLIIEGDNLEVLKLLQKSYLGQVKMIYIDPPYNTGNDFIYPDNFGENLKTYLQYTGQVDAEGRRFGTNTEADGRFHSKWLNMMYPRLFLARNLLREDGILYVSIDETEAPNLQLMLNDIFGDNNALAVLTRVAKLTSNKGTHFSPACDFILSYARDVDRLPELSDASAQEDDDYVALFRFEDARGKYNEVSLYMPSLDFRPNQHYLIECPDGSQVIPPAGKVFRWTRPTFNANLADNRVVFKQTKTSPLLDSKGKQAGWNVYTKIYLHERIAKGLRPSTLLDDKSYTNSSASKELIRLGIDFPFSKPMELIRHLAKISGMVGDDIAMDFFAGSGSLAHGIMKLNAEDNGKRKFVLVQIPEPIDQDKFPTIFEIAKERVRRVCAKLDTDAANRKDLFGENAQDRGFRVFKLAESNLLGWDGSASKDAAALEKQLEMHIDHLRQGRTDKDLLYELLLKSGYKLTDKVVAKTLAGKTVYDIADGGLMICLDRALTLELIRAMADERPTNVVCLDAGFDKNDQLKANAVLTFKSKGVTSFRTV